MTKRKKTNGLPVWLTGVVALWICANPALRGDAPSEYPDINPVQLSAGDLDFGQQQMDRILHDRPELAVYVQCGDPVYRWVVRQLAGGATGQHVYWLEHFQEDYPLEYPSYCTSPPAIAIRNRYASGSQKGQALSGSMVGGCLVFESFNISRRKQNLADYQAALLGTISREAYIEKCTRNEFATIQETKRFYREIWVPMLVRKGLEDDHSWAWCPDWPDDYSQWTTWFTDPNGYPFNVFGRDYDRAAASRAKSAASREEATEVPEKSKVPVQEESRPAQPSQGKGNLEPSPKAAPEESLPYSSLAFETRPAAFRAMSSTGGLPLRGNLSDTSSGAVSASNAGKNLLLNLDHLRRISSVP